MDSSKNNIKDGLFSDPGQFKPEINTIVIPQMKGNNTFDLVYKKDYDFLLNAYKQLWDKINLPNYKYYLLGENAVWEYDKGGIELIIKNNLEVHTHKANISTEEDIYDLLSAIDGYYAYMQITKEEYEELEKAQTD